jgi:hypothetical protein
VADGCQKDYSLIVTSESDYTLNTMALIACYCRVSTRHQKTDSQRAEHIVGESPFVPGFIS